LKTSVYQECHICLGIWKETSDPVFESVFPEACEEFGALSKCDISFRSQPSGTQGWLTFKATGTAKGFNDSTSEWGYDLALYLASEVGMQPVGSNIADIDSIAHVREKFRDREVDQASQILEWLRDCNESHTECASFAPKRYHLPSRLVEVNGPTDHQVRIVDTRKAPVKGQYTTLSYC
jgi:hypothetical protein